MPPGGSTVKDGRSDRKDPKRYGRNLLSVKSALEIAQSLAAPSSRTLLSRGPATHRSGATRTCQSSQTHRSMDRTQSHHVGKWQAKRETHGTASTACNEGRLCANRIGPRVRGQVPVG